MGAALAKIMLSGGTVINVNPSITVYLKMTPLDVSHVIAILEELRIIIVM